MLVEVRESFVKVRGSRPYFAVTLMPPPRSSTAIRLITEVLEVPKPVVKVVPFAPSWVPEEVAPATSIFPDNVTVVCANADTLASAAKATRDFFISTLEKLEMKKSLVALAALASVSAFAQSSVTLSGNMDVAGVNYGGTQTGAKGTSFTTGAGTSSTSVINIIAVEDLGGGMKVTGKYGIDPRTLTDDALAVTNNPRTDTTSTNNPQATKVTGLSRDEAFIGIEGAFGSIKLGAPNSTSLDTHSASSPAGTGIASGYTYKGDTNSGWNNVAQTRYNRSFKYESPVVNGISAAVVYAPGNDQASVAGSTSLANLNVPNARTATELGLKYSNGPLNLAYSNVSQAAQTNATGWFAVGAASTGQTSTYGYVATKTNSLGANYNLGATTLYYGYANGDSIASTTSQTKAKGSRLGIKQSFGSTDLIAQYTTVKTTTSALVDQTYKISGFRLDQNLSKTAKVYVGYEYADSGTAVETAVPESAYSYPT